MRTNCLVEQIISESYSRSKKVKHQLFWFCRNKIYVQSFPLLFACIDRFNAKLIFFYHHIFIAIALNVFSRAAILHELNVNINYISKKCDLFLVNRVLIRSTSKLKGCISLLYRWNTDKHRIIVSLKNNGTNERYDGM